MGKVLLEQIRQYKYIGIRGCTDDENYSIGDTCRNSYDWDYENDISSFETENPIELGGTCAVNTGIDIDWDEDYEIEEKINAIVENFNYYGKIVIIGSMNVTYGADDNEIIMENAKVIKILGE